MGLYENWRNPNSNGLKPYFISSEQFLISPGHGALGLCLAGPGHETCRDGPLQRLQRWWTRPNRRQESDGILAGLPNHQRSGCVDFSPAKLGF